MRIRQLAYLKGLLDVESAILEDDKNPYETAEWCQIVWIDVDVVL